MSTIKKSLVVALTVLAFLPRLGEATDTTLNELKKDIVLMRRPFGVAPKKRPVSTVPTPTPVPRITAAQRNFAKTLRISYMRKTERGLSVRIVDTRTRKAIVLEVGQTKDGLSLLDADFAAEKAQVQKGPVKAEITSRAGDGAVTLATGTSPATTFWDKRKKMLEERRNRRKAALRRKPKLTGAALEEHLRTYNKWLIKQGGEAGPPLPIQLTPEDDNELVREGFLPPME